MNKRVIALGLVIGLTLTALASAEILQQRRNRLRPRANRAYTAHAAAATATATWETLFTGDLSDAIFPKGVWYIENGELTASKDEGIWTKKQYENFVLDLEFKTAPGTNSGVFVYGSDISGNKWIPNSIEIQIADDFAEKWAKVAKTWQCAAIFGRKAPTKSAVKKPGEWNHLTVTCRGPEITVVLNGEQVNQIDLRKWTSATTNPDGSPIPKWLSKPAAELPTKGHVGLQGKHAGAPISFRNIKIKSLD